MLVPVYDIANCGPRHRFGANGKLVSNCNWQNFPRNERDGGAGEIRGSLLAPEGFHIVVGDLSQVECRVLNWLAGQHDVIERFQLRLDPYTNIASKFYGFEVTKEHKKERGLGKLAELSMGYGAGTASVIETAKRGTYGPPVHLSQEEGERAKQLYRSTHKAVTAMWWQTAEQALRVLEARGVMEWGPMHIEDGAIWLPNGLPLWYDEFKRDGGDLFCLIRGRWRKMWGTKLVQHVCEALARNIISDAALRLHGLSYRAINTTHDELMFLAPVDKAPAALQAVLSELKKTPTWAPGLPLDAEGAEGPRYAK